MKITAVLLTGCFLGMRKLALSIAVLLTWCFGTVLFLGRVVRDVNDPARLSRRVSKPLEACSNPPLSRATLPEGARHSPAIEPHAIKLNDACDELGDFRLRIIVLAYNRPQSLLRLLDSLRGAHYCGFVVPLEIRIDFGGVFAVESLAGDFVWPHGPKIVRKSGRNQGLVNMWMSSQDSRVRQGLALFCRLR